LNYDNADSGQSCRELFRRLNILPLYSQYILFLLLFVVKNVHLFRRNSTIHSFNTRQCSELYLPPVRLTKVQKGVYHFGVTVFKGLPFRIKDLSGDLKKFTFSLKVSLGRFILLNSRIF
jgi:hypothetical protein